MTVGIERLRQAARRVHAAAEKHHRLNGYTAPLLVALQTDGPETLILLPDGFPSQGLLDEIARQTRAAAFVVTAEAWVSIPGLSARTVAALPREDLPVPVEDPNRGEAIITTAVGLGPGQEPYTLLRASRIERGAFGTQIHEARDDFAGVHVDHVEAQLAAALIRRRHRPGDRDPH